MKDVKRFIKGLKALHRNTQRVFVEEDMQADMLAAGDDYEGSFRTRVAALSMTVKDMLVSFEYILTVLEDMSDAVCGDKKNEVRVHLDNGEFLDAFEAKVDEFKEIARRSNEALGKLVMQQFKNAVNLFDKEKSPFEHIHDDQIRARERACERFTVVLKNYMRENWSEELKEKRHDGLRIESIIITLLNELISMRAIKKEKG